MSLTLDKPCWELDDGGEDGEDEYTDRDRDEGDVEDEVRSMDAYRVPLYGKAAAWAQYTNKRVIGRYRHDASGIWMPPVSSTELRYIKYH